MKRFFIVLSFLCFMVSSKAQFVSEVAQSGHEINITAGVNITPPKPAWGYHGIERSGCMIVGYGYNVSKYFYAGGSTGAFFDVGMSTEQGGAVLLPVMADLRFSYPLGKKLVPYVHVRSGYGFTINDSPNKDYAIFNPTLGLAFHISRAIDFRLAAGFMGLWGHSNTVYDDLCGFSLQAGASFRL